MSSNKTRPGEGDVPAFIDAIENPVRRADAFTALELFSRVTGQEPVMWGASLVGFGQYHYHYASGRQGDFMLTGFSPRKQNLVVYIMPGFDTYGAIMERLGKFKTGKSCLYINKLEDIDLQVLEELVAVSVKDMRKKYG